jgi:hypothetical protein
MVCGQPPFLWLRAPAVGGPIALAIVVGSLLAREYINNGPPRFAAAEIPLSVPAGTVHESGALRKVAAVTVFRDKHFPKASTVSLPPQLLR